jgi:hypothetical protein
VPLNSQGILVTCDAGREDRAGDEAAALIEEVIQTLRPAASRLWADLSFLLAAPEPEN